MSQKEIKELREELLELAKQVREIARWQAYYAISKNPNVFNKEQRKEIIELAKGSVTYPLFIQLFKEYPLLEN